MIYVGIDDTDRLDTPGTNQLARSLIADLEPEYPSVVAVRHQLLIDPRVPCTSKNSSASIVFQPEAAGAVEALTERIRRLMVRWFVDGSDPGLCVTDRVPEEITHFGQRCQQQLISQVEARRLAAREGIYLEGLGGSQDGVIGALAAVGLVAAGNDGRVVHIAPWPDDLCGPQEIGLLRARGVDEIRRVDSGEPVLQGTVDVGKHLRPNYRGGKVVLFVAPSDPDPSRRSAPWRAVRLT